MKTIRRTAVALPAVVLVLVLAACGGRNASSSSTTGSSTSKTITIGGTFPMSGQLAAYAAVAQGAQAYFDLVNAQGGVQGRKIKFEAVDDGYDPARTLQNTQKLVEQDGVLAIFGTLGTPTNLAIRDYLNTHKVPQLFVYSGAPELVSDTAKDHYTLLGLPDYTGEGSVYGAYLKQSKPSAKLAVLYQNDAYGKSILSGLQSSIQGSGVKIVARQGYEATAPTVDTEVTKLARSGADVFVNIASSKFAAQAIKKVGDLGWKPLQILNSPSSSKSGVLEPAGLANAKGIISIQYFKDPETPRWANDQDMAQFRDAMGKYVPHADAKDPKTAQGWVQAEMLVAALKGMKQVSRDGLLAAARSLNTKLPLMLPGIDVSTSDTNSFPIRSVSIQRFDGAAWQPEGSLIKLDQ